MITVLLLLASAAVNLAQEAASNFHLAPPGAHECDYGQTVSEAECEDAALRVAGNPGRSLQVGRGGRCLDGSWGQVPLGCSAQTGGDKAAHFKKSGDTGAGCISKAYQLVCTNSVDGGWSEWTNGSCSLTCGSGTMTATRTCTNPSPAGEGAQCAGDAETTHDCNEHACVSRCPVGHEFPYLNGKMCCSANEEETNMDAKCFGRSFLPYDTDCCRGARIACPDPPCAP